MHSCEALHSCRLFQSVVGREHKLKEMCMRAEHCVQVAWFVVLCAEKKMMKELSSCDTCRSGNAQGCVSCFHSYAVVSRTGFYVQEGRVTIEFLASWPASIRREGMRQLMKSPELINHRYAEFLRSVRLCVSCELHDLHVQLRNLLCYTIYVPCDP